MRLEMGMGAGDSAIDNASKKKIRFGPKQSKANSLFIPLQICDVNTKILISIK